MYLALGCGCQGMQYLQDYNTKFVYCVLQLCFAQLMPIGVWSLNTEHATHDFYTHVSCCWVHVCM